MASREHTPADAASQRIAYQPPQIKQWGEVTDITRDRNLDPIGSDPGSTVPDITPV